MKNILTRKNLIEIICTLYIILSVIIFFITKELSNNQIKYINNILDTYLWGNIGIYSSMEPFYSKLVVNILATITPILTILFFPIRKQVKKHRKTDSLFHYVFTLGFIYALYWFLWGGSWKLIRGDNFSLLREMINFNLIVCPLYGLFINEVWYLVDMIEKLYLTVTGKINRND